METVDERRSCYGSSTAAVAAARLGRALGEVGRIAKTIFLLAYLDDRAYRRRILSQINRGEARHALARKVFTATTVSCTISTARARRTSSAPGIVVDAIALWNTRYMVGALGLPPCQRGPRPGRGCRTPLTPTPPPHQSPRSLLLHPLRRRRQRRTGQPSVRRFLDRFSVQSLPGPSSSRPSRPAATTGSSCPSRLHVHRRREQHLSLTASTRTTMPGNPVP
ncbi:MAG: transposase [Actinobacteria bacterium]|nr:transposase [Actinomycetota bacterium]